MAIPSAQSKLTDANGMPSIFWYQFFSQLSQIPSFSNLGNYVNDAAAAAGGVQVGAIYRNGSVLMVRVS